MDSHHPSFDSKFSTLTPLFNSTFFRSSSSQPAVGTTLITQMPLLVTLLTKSLVLSLSLAPAVFPIPRLPLPGTA